MAISKKYLMVAALVAFMLLPAAALAANDITVKVIDKDGNEIEGATVTLTNSSGDDIKHDTTDSKGKAELTSVSDGDYGLEVTHDNYQDVSGEGILEDLDGDIDVLVVMRPIDTLSLTITVVDEKGDGIKDVDVSIESLDKEIKKADYDDCDDYDICLLANGNKYKAFEYDESDTTDKKGEVTFEDLEFNTDYNITLEKSGYVTTWAKYSYPNYDSDEDPEDEDVDLEFVQPGTATYKAIVKDEDGRAIAGATVRIVGTDSSHSYTLTTNSAGEATFTVYSPEVYDIAVTKDDYSTGTDTDWSAVNDAQKTKTFTLNSENVAPVANAGPDKYGLIGSTIELDASGSSDPEGEPLTYEWTDSLGATISSVQKPSVTFDTTGTHRITLTVSDGSLNATDEVLVTIDDPANCGDNVCTVAERAVGQCPQDCPACGDTVCGIGESDSALAEYCPADCGIGPKVLLSNTSALVAGNTTEISLVDPTSGGPVTGAQIQITAPNGSVTTPEMFMNTAVVTFSSAGTYTIEATADNYAVTIATVEVRSPSDLGWLLWVVIVVLIVLLAFLLMRYMGSKGGKAGYRANKFRRRKPTLSSI